MTRIRAISKRINNQEAIVIDVGSDHAYLAIELLKNHQAKFVYNIEINKHPLINTINNLQKASLINQTNNLLNDGLKNLDQIIKDPIDYLVISGMGAKNIITILKNKPKNLVIKNYIIVSNNHPEMIREYLKQNNLFISYEAILKQNEIFYFLIEFSNKFKTNISNDFDLYFGPYNLTQKLETFCE